MNLRVTAGFLAVAIVLGVIVIGLDKFNLVPQTSASATSTATSAQEVQILQFDDSKVTAFEITSSGNTVHVDKNGDNWIVAGTGALANQASFTSLITRMAQLKATFQVPNPGDLSQYGLDHPTDSATATLNDGTSDSLQLGNKTPTSSGVYAKRADTGDVYVIATQFQSDLERLVCNPNQPPTPTPRPATDTPTPAPSPSGTPAPTDTPFALGTPIAIGTPSP